MPNSPAWDIATKIMEAGIASTDPSSNLPLIRVGFEPDVNEKTLLTIYDTGGQPSNPAYQRDYPRIQVRTKSPNEMGYNQAFKAQQDVKDLILGMDRFTVTNDDLSETLYVGIWMQVDISPLAPDQNKRPVLISSYRIVREYTSANRRPIV